MDFSIFEPIFAMREAVLRDRAVEAPADLLVERAGKKALMSQPEPPRGEEAGKLMMEALKLREAALKALPGAQNLRITAKDLLDAASSEHQSPESELTAADRAAGEIESPAPLPEFALEAEVPEEPKARRKPKKKG